MRSKRRAHKPLNEVNNWTVIEFPNNFSCIKSKERAKRKRYKFVSVSIVEFTVLFWTHCAILILEFHSTTVIKFSSIWVSN